MGPQGCILAAKSPWAVWRKRSGCGANCQYTCDDYG